MRRRKEKAYLITFTGTKDGVKKRFEAWFNAYTPTEARSKLYALARKNSVTITDVERVLRKPVHEAEDPKSFLRRASAEQASRSIWDSRNYFLNIAKPDQDWMEAEFCPVMIHNGNRMDQFDGVYGLIEDVYQAYFRAMNYRQVPQNPTEAEEDRCGEALDVYLEPIYDLVHKGVTSGLVNGIAGARKWRIVYTPDPHERDWERWKASVVPVEAGKRYGPPMPREEALALAERILEGEDPKSFLRGLSRQKPYMRVLAKPLGLPHFVIQSPIYLNRFYRYDFDDPPGLSAEQQKWLDFHHEVIFFNLNDGDTHGELSNLQNEDEPDADEVPTGEWVVVGNLNILGDKDTRQDRPVD